MQEHKIQIEQLIDMNNSQSVLDEVKIIVFRIFPEYDFKILEEVFNDILNLFNGKYPGYRK